MADTQNAHTQQNTREEESNATSELGSLRAEITRQLSEIVETSQQDISAFKQTIIGEEGVFYHTQLEHINKLDAQRVSLQHTLNALSQSGVAQINQARDFVVSQFERGRCDAMLRAEIMEEDGDVPCPQGDPYGSS